MFSDYFNKLLGPQSQLRKEFDNSLVMQWSVLGILILFFFMFITAPYLAWRDDQAVKLVDKLDREQALIRLSENRSAIEKSHQTLNALYSDTQAMLIDAPSFNRALSISLNKIESMYQPLGLRFDTRRFGDPSDLAWVGEKVPSRWGWVGSSQEVSDLLYKMASEKTIFIPNTIDLKPTRDRDGNTQFELSATIWTVRSLSIEQLKQQQRAVNR